MIAHMETVAQRLKIAREAKGWNQRKLALASGLTPSAIGNIEAGTRQAKGSLPQIADALGISYRWLAHGEGDMKSTDQGPAHSTLSPHAIELAEMFDLIPATDRIRRAQAYTQAMTAIVSVLEGRATALPERRTKSRSA